MNHVYFGDVCKGSILLNSGCRKCGKCAIELDQRVKALESLLNTPETAGWLKGVELEAAHQIERWGAKHDAGKAPADWFWLLGYLGGKALAAHATGNTEKALHHTISSGAALLNWHRAISGTDTRMRPGIEVAKQ